MSLYETLNLLFWNVIDQFEITFIKSVLIYYKNSYFISTWVVCNFDTGFST